MSSGTLEDYLAAHAAGGKPQAKAVSDVVAALARGVVEIQQAVGLGALGSAFAGTQGALGGGGDVPRDLDLHADAVLLDALRGAPVALYASEELEKPVLINPAAPLAVAVDPLDGSSNIDTNMSIGTIFSVMPVSGAVEAGALQSYLQPGTRQLASGFFIYGPQLSLAVTVGQGTDIFVYSSRLQAFVRAYAEVSVPLSSPEFAINAANYRHWDQGIRHYYDDCIAGATGPHGRDFNMRWAASMVADAYRILIRGGIFMYPADARKGYASGRLRLVYEANPVAMLLEQAGGSATDGVEPILSRTPASLHEKVPLVFGSRTEVHEVARYAAEHDSMGLRSPLFGTRGLFRA